MCLCAGASVNTIGIIKVWGVWKAMQIWVCYVYCVHRATYQILLKMNSTFSERLNETPRLWDCWVMYLLYSDCADLKWTKQHALTERCCMQLGNQSLHASLLTTPVCSLYTLSTHYFDIWIPPWTQIRTQTQTQAWLTFSATFHLTAKHKRFCKASRNLIISGHPSFTLCIQWVLSSILM